MSEQQVNVTLSVKELKKLKKMSRPFWKKKRFIFPAVVIAIIVFAVASNGGKSSSSTSSNASSSTSNQPATLSNSGVSSNVQITVEGLETKDTVGDNQFSTAKAQGVYKVVNLKLTNNQKDAITIDSNSFKLVDSQGREFTNSSDAQMALATSTVDKKESFFLKQINPGITVAGNVVFDVPKDAKGFTLKAHGGFTGKEITLKVE